MNKIHISDALVFRKETIAVTDWLMTLQNGSSHLSSNAVTDIQRVKTELEIVSHISQSWCH